MYRRVGWLVLGILVACGDDAPSDSGSDATADGSAMCATPADCDDGAYCNGAETCEPGAGTADARGCVRGDAPCGDGACDEATATCTGVCADADGDGRRDAACGGDDCDDADPNRFPGNPEVCDAVDHDEDCDLETFGFRDGDMDGSPDERCCNGDNCGRDCDDANPGVHRAHAEVCDGFDNDCDGEIDEGVTQLFYPDRDGDGYGAVGSTGTPACSMPGSATTATDCNDDVMAIHPGAFDRCDGVVDDDCDGTPDNPPGGCSCTAGESRACPGTMGACAEGTQTCVDGTWSECDVPAEAETCNDIDDDCDGMTDEGFPANTYYFDNDGDGFGDPDVEPRLTCGSAPMGYVSNNSDCYDRSDQVYPGQIVYSADGYMIDGRVSHDYNCNGIQEFRYGPGMLCNRGCMYVEGYVPGSVGGGRVFCGERYDVITGCTDACGTEMSSERMPCR